MPDILALLLCLQPCVTITTLRHLSRITPALLTMTGRVTMLGISRWSGKGASYRTIQRFFSTPAQYRGSMYVLETLKLLPEPPDEDRMAQIVRHVASLGRIHPVEPHLNAT